MGFSIGSYRTVTLVPLTMPSNNEKRTFPSDKDKNLLGLVTEIMKNAFPPLFKVIAERSFVCVFFLPPCMNSTAWQIPKGLLPG